MADEKIELFIIDIHSHLDSLSPDREKQRDHKKPALAALKTMKEFGIIKCLVMPPPFGTRQQPYDFEELLPIIREYPDQFAFLGGGGSLNVMIQQSAHLKEVNTKQKQQFTKRALEILKQGAVGFGEMTAEHFSLGEGHPYESAPPDHPLFLLLADIAAEHKVPIDIHMEAIPEDMPLPEELQRVSTQNPKKLKGNIEAFERLLLHNREANIIWAHVGWDNTGYRTLTLTRRLLQAHPNLYLSIKTDRRCFPQNRIIRGPGEISSEWLELIQGFPDRFIIGSDQFYTPGLPMERIIASYKLLKLFPPEIARQIAYENPMRIYHLK